jgi:hypothetical protein
MYNPASDQFIRSTLFYVYKPNIQNILILKMYVYSRGDDIPKKRNLVISFYSFIHQWYYRPLLGPSLFFSFIIFFLQSVGPLGQVISPSQGRYLHTGQHKHRINAHADIHVRQLLLQDKSYIVNRKFIFRVEYEQA